MLTCRLLIGRQILRLRLPGNRHRDGRRQKKHPRRWFFELFGGVDALKVVVNGSGYRVQGSGSRVQGPGSRVQGGW